MDPPNLHSFVMQANTSLPLPVSKPTTSRPLLYCLPSSISGPVRARRRRFYRFHQASAYLKGTALVVQTPTQLLATLDVHHVIDFPNNRILIRSEHPYKSIELRIDENRPQWIAALKAAAERRAPRLADFHVVAPIGKGGGGVVFFVREVDGDGKGYAMKVVQKCDVFYTDGSFRHAMDERVVMELVRGFPFVVRMKAAFQTDSALYMVSEFCGGGNLRTKLGRKKLGRMEEEEAKTVMIQIVLALEFLHSMNIIYRDMKPENVLFGNGGEVRLCDFGLSKVLCTGRFGRTKSYCGSTSYMSPQICGKKSYGIATDLWSMGALFYRMLVGRAPFDQPTRQLGSRNDAVDVQRRIQLDELSLPSFLSLAAREMLEGLLRKDENHRTNLQDLKESLFFKGVDWDAELEEGYRLASSPASVDWDGELDNFESKKLLSNGVVLRDAELKSPRKSSFLGLEPRVGKNDDLGNGIMTRKVSKFSSSFTIRRPSQMSRKVSMNSIIGFGFSAGDADSYTASDSVSSASLQAR